MLKELHDKHLLQGLLKFAEISAAGYSKWRKRQQQLFKRQQGEQLRMEPMMTIYRARSYYGYLRVTA